MYMFVRAFINAKTLLDMSTSEDSVDVHCRVGRFLLILGVCRLESVQLMQLINNPHKVYT